MRMLLRREFIVELPVKDAWQHLSNVEKWPTWAKHIKQVKLRAGSPLNPKSQGVIYLSNGIKSAFTMVEFNPYNNWKWGGRFLWLARLQRNHNLTKIRFVVPMTVCYPRFFSLSAYKFIFSPYSVTFLKNIFS